MCAQILDDGGVHLGSDPLGPAGGVEEVAGAEEVDEEGRQGACVGELPVLLGGALQLAAGEADLLVDVLALGDLVEVLDADLAVADLAVLAVVGPVLGVDAPATAVPAVLLHVIVEAEAADDDDAATGAAQGGDLGLGPPA